MAASTKDWSDTKLPVDVAGFAALGSVARARILTTLLAGPKRPTELADMLPKAMGLWHHMSVLVDQEFVLAHNIEPKFVQYYLNPLRLRALALALLDMVDKAPEVPQEVLEAYSLIPEADEADEADEALAVPVIEATEGGSGGGS